MIHFPLLRLDPLLVVVERRSVVYKATIHYILRMLHRGTVRYMIDRRGGSQNRVESILSLPLQLVSLDGVLVVGRLLDLNDMGRRHFIIIVNA